VSQNGTLLSLNDRFFSSLAELKKDEGNALYKTKDYREALQRYTEAISKYSFTQYWLT